MNNEKDYASRLERELAARLLKEAISAEPDFDGVEYARMFNERWTRFVADYCDDSKRGLLVGPVAPFQPEAESGNRQPLKS